MKRINIYITTKQFEALKALGEPGLSDHIRRAIDEYLAHLAKRERKP